MKSSARQVVLMSKLFCEAARQTRTMDLLCLLCFLVWCLSWLS